MFVGQRTESLRQRDRREELIHRARSCRHGWFTLEKEGETATSVRREDGGLSEIMKGQKEENHESS